MLAEKTRQDRYSGEIPLPLSTFSSFFIVEGGGGDVAVISEVVHRRSYRGDIERFGQTLFFPVTRVVAFNCGAYLESAFYFFLKYNSPWAIFLK